MTTPVLELMAAAYLRVHALVNDPEIRDAQWQSGHTPSPKEDTSERSIGLVNDPTPNIVMDTRRLNVRAAVIESEAALEAAQRTLRAVENHLSKALALVTPEGSEPAGGV